MIVGRRPKRRWWEWPILLLMAFLTYYFCARFIIYTTEFFKEGWLTVIAGFPSFCMCAWFVWGLRSDLMRQSHLAVFHIDVGIEKPYPYLKLHPYGFDLYEKGPWDGVRMNVDGLEFRDDSECVRAKFGKDGLTIYDENEIERVRLNEHGLTIYDEHLRTWTLPETGGRTIT